MNIEKPIDKNSRIYLLRLLFRWCNAEPNAGRCERVLLMFAVVWASCWLKGRSVSLKIWGIHKSYCDRTGIIMGNSSNKVAVASQISMLDSNHNWSASLCSGSVMSKRQAISNKLGIQTNHARSIFFIYVIFAKRDDQTKSMIMATPPFLVHHLAALQWHQPHWIFFSASKLTDC